MSSLQDSPNRVAALRQARGLAVAELARQAGVGRQTMYAIEAGQFVPNTVVALRLARALQSTVEALFPLPAEAGQAPQAVVLPDGVPAPLAGQPLAVARVGRRLVAHALTPAPAYLPAAQAIATEAGAALVLDETVESRLLIAGCDPALSLLARHALTAGVAVALVPANSAQSLRWLKSGHTHLAGCHLADESGGMNLDAVRQELGRTAAAVVTFAAWEEGLVMAAGNPHSIRTAADLARRGIRLINRELGAGARRLLDRHLAQAGVPAAQVHGYSQTAAGHLAAAWQVAAGWADVCVAPLAAARAFGLGFVPLASERFDLVVRQEHLALPAVSRLLDVLNRAALRQELAAFAGYDVTGTGGRVR